MRTPGEEYSAISAETKSDKSDRQTGFHCTSAKYWFKLRWLKRRQHVGLLFDCVSSEALLWFHQRCRSAPIIWWINFYEAWSQTSTWKQRLNAWPLFTIEVFIAPNWLIWKRMSPRSSLHTVHKVFLVSHKSTIRAELYHFFQVLLDIWEALQHLLKVIPGQREALAVSECLHGGQMFAFGQYARFCWTHRGNHKSVENERVNPSDRGWDPTINPKLNNQASPTCFEKIRTCPYLKPEH